MIDPKRILERLRYYRLRNERFDRLVGAVLANRLAGRALRTAVAAATLLSGQREQQLRELKSKRAKERQKVRRLRKRIQRLTLKTQDSSQQIQNAQTSQQRGRTKSGPKLHGSQDARANWAEAALAQYGLRDARVDLLKEGEDQRKLVFRVESPTRGCFLLRVYKLARHSENLVPELLWLQALQREMPLSVAEPIPAADGSLLSYAAPEWASEPRRCVLLRWLPGKRGKDDMTPANLSLAGSHVARLHRYSEQHGVPKGLVFPHVWDWDWVFGEKTPLWNKKGRSVYTPNELDVFRAAAERVRQDLQELGKGSNVFGVIHRDLHLKNILFHDGKAYAIDFEVCGWGYYLFDVAVTLSSLEGHETPLQVALLEGYQRERPLPEEHWRYLETFMAMRLVQRVNGALRWRRPTQRRWGPRLRASAVKQLKAFTASEREAGQIDMSSPWWRKAFRDKAFRDKTFRE